MNGAYFVIPFLLIGLIPVAFGEIENGFNYDKELLSVGEDGVKKFRWTSTPDRIHDGTEYRDFIFTDNANSLQVETLYGSVVLDKTTCGFSFHNRGFIHENPIPLLTDSIVPFSSIVDLYSWNEVTQISTASCQATWDGSELVATKQVSGLGMMQYKYIYVNGEWKTQLEATNLTGLTDRVFGFDQTINLNRDIVFFGGNQRNLDNYDGTTFDRNWLENNQGSVIQFLNGYHFDFDLGFDYLDSISIINDGENSTKLVLHYMRNNEILLPNETLVIDPTYGYTSADDYWVYGSNTISSTCPTANTKDTVTVKLEWDTNVANSNCIFGAFEWDISSIPDTSSIVDSIKLRIDTNGPVGDPYCDVTAMAVQPSVASAADIWAAFSSTIYLDDDAFCNTAQTNVVVTLDAASHADLLDSLSSDWWAVGMTSDDFPTRDATRDKIGITDVELEVVYSDIPRPDAVDDLTSPSQTFGSVTLTWTEPALNTGNVSGYQINYSTPWGKPLTVITESTGNDDVTATVTNLDLGTDYTFGVSAITEGGNNATHPPMTWLNVTTIGNFTIGTATFNQTNTEVLPITFEEQNINSTAKFLNVTFSNSFVLNCDFDYKFANTNHTYKGLTGTAVSTTLNETSFILNDFENEIIGVYCRDQLTGTDADYLLIQNDFPLLQQIASFRAGDYGTEGQIGVFDFITLAIIIFSMIGLNRVNESVGAVFNVALLGALAYFGIIELPTVIFGLLAVVLIFAITSTRKT